MRADSAGGGPRVEREHRWQLSERGELFGATDDVRLAAGRLATHIRGFLQHLRDREAESRRVEVDAPPEFYLVEERENEIVELLGFKLRGHPLAMIGAFRFPRHKRSPVPHGRQSIGTYLSAPPRVVAVRGAALPPGLLLVHLPSLADSIPEFVTRVRDGRAGEPFVIDPALVEIAFDFRFQNPSEIKHVPAQGEGARKYVLRTIGGHVLSGISYEMRQALHRDSQFLTITAVVQHTVDGLRPLPTLAIHRDFVTMARPVGHDMTVATLAFHPQAATKQDPLGLNLPLLATANSA